MKRNKFENELKQQKELLAVCLDVLEELEKARTYHAIRKKEMYEKKVAKIRENIQKLSFD